MNFLEIGQEILELADRDPFILTTMQVTDDTLDEHRKIIQSIKFNYKRVQRRSKWSRFMWKEGVFLTTQAGKSDYKVAKISAVIGDSLKYRRVGDSVESPLCLIEFQDFRRLHIGELNVEGTPRELIRLPSDVFRVWPTPSGIFEILASWSLRLDELVADDDEPRWHEDYHDYLVWLGAEDFAKRNKDEELMALVTENLPEIKNAFWREYRPTMQKNLDFAG